MDKFDLVLGSLIGLTALIVLSGVRLGLWSVKSATITMLIVPFALNMAIVFLDKREALEVICVGPLLSLSFGPATYIVCRFLENKFREKENRTLK